jgi:hypothetical protein
LVSGSQSHAAWSPSGLKGGVLANVFDTREAQKIFWLFDRAWRGQTDTRFRDSPRGMLDTTTQRGEHCSPPRPTAKSGEFSAVVLGSHLGDPCLPAELVSSGPYRHAACGAAIEPRDGHDRSSCAPMTGGRPSDIPSRGNPTKHRATTSKRRTTTNASPQVRPRLCWQMSCREFVDMEEVRGSNPRAPTV